jgi:hypothetical protein
VSLLAGVVRYPRARAPSLEWRRSGIIAKQFGVRFIGLNIYTVRGEAPSSRRAGSGFGHPSGRSIAALWAEKNLGPLSVM